MEIGNLAELLQTLDYEGDWLATAVNGHLAHREDRASHVLKDGDRIEILSPMQEADMAPESLRQDRFIPPAARHGPLSIAGYRRSRATIRHRYRHRLPAA